MEQDYKVMHGLRVFNAPWLWSIKMVTFCPWNASLLHGLVLKPGFVKIVTS